MNTEKICYSNQRHLEIFMLARDSLVFRNYLLSLQVSLITGVCSSFNNCTFPSCSFTLKFNSRTKFVPFHQGSSEFRLFFSFAKYSGSIGASWAGILKLFPNREVVALKMPFFFFPCRVQLHKDWAKITPLSFSTTSSREGQLSKRMSAFLAAVT